MSDQRTLQTPSLDVSSDGKKLTISPQPSCMIFICDIINTKALNCILLIDDCECPYEDYKGLKISAYWPDSHEPSELTTYVLEEEYEDLMCHTYATDMAPQIATFGRGAYMRVLAVRFVGVEKPPLDTDKWFADISFIGGY